MKSTYVCLLVFVKQSNSLFVERYRHSIVLSAVLFIDSKSQTPELIYCKNIQFYIVMLHLCESRPVVFPLNKSHLFSLKQHKFLEIQLITLTCMLHVPLCTYSVFRHVNTKPIQRKIH